MNSNSITKNDPRIAKIVDIILKMADGNLSVRETPGEKGDEIDSVIIGLNLLAELLQKSRTELKQARRYLSRIIKSIADILIVVNLKGIIKMVNPSTLSLLGFNEVDLIDNSIAKVIGKYELEEFLENQSDELVANECIRGIEGIITKKNGQKLAVLISVSIMKDEMENIEGCVIVAQDNTHQKQAEEEVNRMNEELESAMSELEKAHLGVFQELQHAQITQQALFPNHLPKLDNAKLNIKYIPEAHIGGDFYDVFFVKENQLGIMIGDVTGHGISAALISFMAFTVFKSKANQQKMPNVCLSQTNRDIAGKMPKGTFASIFYGIFDPANRTIRYANAGHPPGIVIRPETLQIFELQADGTVVGMFKNPIIEYEERQFQLYPGDKMLLYTDGMTEVTNKKDQMISQEILYEFFKDNVSLSIEDILEQTYQFCLKFSGKKGFDDDFTLVGLEVF